MAQFRKDTHQYLADGKTIFEAVMLADQYGNLVGAANPSGMAIDAFGRARTSAPLTLFDSFHRFQDNGKIATSNTAGGTFAYNANTAMIEMTIDNTTGAEVKRETSRVFAYQPGKSLQVMISFCMNSPKTGLRQRAGYFNDQNGIFIQQNNSTVSIVKRSYVTGTTVDTAVNQADWNMDTLDGTGPSGITLDLTKTHIFFMDFEWLGVGTVRCGFVINGRFIHCHSFQHANILTTTYMTTACLPGRVEITNTGGMSGTATYRQVCFTVLSEGGYDIRGRSRAAGLQITSPKTLTTAGTFYPIISIRLKDTRSEGIVVPTDAEFFGISNNTRYRYKIVTGGTLTSPTWVSAGDDSCVEYDISASAITGGTDRAMGYVNIAAGAGGAVASLRNNDFFKYQLERNPFATSDKGTVISLVATGYQNNDQAVGAFTWEEIT
jgi:hypothetical protein